MRPILNFVFICLLGTTAAAAPASGGGEGNGRLRRSHVHSRSQDRLSTRVYLYFETIPGNQ